MEGSRAPRFVRHAPRDGEPALRSRVARKACPAPQLPPLCQPSGGACPPMEGSERARRPEKTAREGGSEGALSETQHWGAPTAQPTHHSYLDKPLARRPVGDVSVTRQ